MDDCWYTKEHNEKQAAVQITKIRQSWLLMTGKGFKNQETGSTNLLKMPKKSIGIYSSPRKEVAQKAHWIIDG